MNVLLETYITCEENTEKDTRVRNCALLKFTFQWRLEEGVEVIQVETREKCIPRRKTRICLCHGVPRMLPHSSKDILDICRAF